MQEGELVYARDNVSSREATWFEKLGIPPSSDYFTVEFDSAGGTEIAPQSIKIGKKAKQPKNPTKQGYEFLGWYYLQEGGTEEEPTYTERQFDFDIAINQDYMIYAKYTGEALLRTQSNSVAFWQENYRTKITSIQFKKGAIPTSLPEPNWDIKANSSSTEIRAYIEDDGNDGYTLTIISPTTIYAPARSNNYFRNFSNLVSINFENFDTSRCAGFYRMFHNDTKLSDLNVNNFDTKQAIRMEAMFWWCSSLTSLNLSNWNIGKVKYANQMFSECRKLEKLDLRNFDFSNINEYTNIFSGLSSCIIYTKNSTNAKFVYNIRPSLDIYYGTENNWTKYVE